MTAEVAILNKSAVAVAADSAITVGRTRVHRFANKIFSVSDDPPIGLMVYGYAEHCGIPWETIAKIFRRQHTGTKFKTVAECYTVFRDFLGSPRFFTADAQERNLLFFSDSVMTEIYKEARKLTTRRISAEIPKIIANLPGGDPDKKLTFAPPTSAKFNSDINRFFETVVVETFKDLNYVPPKTLYSPLRRLIRTRLSSSWLSDYEAGVVLFGFGEDELLPSLYSHQFDCGCFNNLRSVEHAQINVGEGPGNVHIVPFADRDVMDVFMEGSNQQSKAFFIAMMLSAMREVADRVVKDNFSGTEDEYSVIKALNEKTITDIIDRTMTIAKRWIYTRNIQPVLNVVTALPKEDMATLAEALVEVTALKKKVSADVESVGGPVDVCLVTKGDGLIWIKRKHYFDIDKNQQYLYNRFGKVGEVSQ